MPAGATYEPLATTTVSGSSTNTITFNSFSGYTDLRIITVGSWSVDQQYSFVTFNGDTGTNYSITTMYGNGSTGGSNRVSNANQLRLGESWVQAGSTTIPTLGIMDIFSYSGSTNKTTLMAGSAEKGSVGGLSREVGLWRSTAAITSITLTASGGFYNAGFTATLYGIARA